MIVTISRQFGAGGALVARMLADRLGWSLVDNELIDQVAIRAGMAPEEVAEHDERAPGFIERLTRALASSMPEFVAPESGTLPDLAEERLVKITERVVSEAAEQGKVILVGRAAPAVLASHPRTLHLQIVAPLANRIARVVERQGIDMKQAEKLIHDADRNRARYHKQYYQRDWADPANYDLVINTARIGIEGTVDIVMDRLRRLGV